MPTILNASQPAKQIPATAEDPATIFNMTGGTLHYGLNANELDPDGHLEPGQSVEVDRPRWIWANRNEPAKVQILRNADR